MSSAAVRRLTGRAPVTPEEVAELVHLKLTMTDEEVLIVKLAAIAGPDGDLSLTARTGGLRAEMCSNDGTFVCYADELNRALAMHLKSFKGPWALMQADTVNLSGFALK